LALATEILIPIEDKLPSYFLGPVGTSDPLEFIEAESQRIPFKAALSRPHEWQDTFKNWSLPPIAGWRNWYKRILDDNSAKTSNWDSLRIFIHPCILPAEFSEGRQNQSTFEYYQPNMMARQLGCGPVPPRLFLHEFLKPKEEIKENLQARRIFEYQCSPTVYTWL
jgi:hypothetical protein